MFFFSHNNFANNLYLLENNILRNISFTDLSTNVKWINSNGSHTDLKRLIDGKVRGQVSKGRYFNCKT